MWETFSKRRKAEEKAGQADVFQYDVLPRPFRVQVIHIWQGAMGVYRTEKVSRFNPVHASPTNVIWQWIHDTLAVERGEFYLHQPKENPKSQCENFLLHTDTDGVLDIVEMSFFVIHDRISRLTLNERQSAEIVQTPEAATKELNDRFREHGIGYQYVHPKLIRVDSQFVHANVIKPALALLNAAGFAGPAQEFMHAFEHHRHGRSKEAIAEALKSFESTMKAICSARNWTVAPPGTAKPLIDCVLQNGLVPANLQNHFGGLRSAMESGLPTLSNSTSRHGQGAAPTVVPPHFAAYALHLAASNIVFLVEAYKALP